MLLFIGVAIVVPAFGTIDMNLPELEYLADHLEPEECRRLVAVLHFKSYNVPNAADNAERKVSEDVPCIRLLLHYNSAAGEGRGNTHEDLEHRLRQLGRADLADWLGRTVFHQLAAEVNRTLLNDPFAELAEETTINNVSAATSSSTTDEATREEPDVRRWTPFDTICVTIIMIMTGLCLAMMGRFVIQDRQWCKGKDGEHSHRSLLNPTEQYSVLFEALGEGKGKSNPERYHTRSPSYNIKINIKS